MRISSGSGKSGSRGSQEKKPLSGDELLARNQAARRNSRPLLDPHGIYGTRSAYRVRTAQRRRRFQFLLTVAAIAAVAAGATFLARENRIPRLRLAWRTNLLTRPAGMPAWGTAAGAAGAAPSVFMLVPTERGTLQPVNLMGGRRGPAFITPLPLHAEPLVVGQVAYTPGADGTLYAVDWQRGRQLWAYRSPATISARPALVSITRTKPAAAGAEDTAATVDSASADSASAGSSSNGSPASERSSGAQPSPPPPEAGPAITVETVAVVVAGDDAGNVSALEAGSGRVLWRRALQAPAGNGLTAVTGSGGDGSKILVPLLAGLGTEGGIQCLDAASGRALWRADLGAAFLPAPALQTAGAVRRVFCVGDNGSVFCLDLASGHRLWKTFAKPLVEGSPHAVVLRGEPLLVNIGQGAAVICGANDGAVRAFDAQNGRLLWVFDAGAPVRCRPRVISLKDASGQRRDTLVFGSDSRFVFGLDVRNGELLWRCRTSGTAFATPGVHEGAIVCLTREGMVEAFTLPA